MPFSEVFFHLVMRIDQSAGKLHELTRKVVETKLAEDITAFGGVSLAVNLLPDHVHILLQSLPTASPDAIVGILMENSTELVTGMGRDEKLVWEKEYGAVSVSKSHIEIVSKYIETQPERHRTGKLNDTLERTNSE